MTPKDLAANLAYSLSNSQWTEEGIENTLRRRLPETLHRLALDLARHLTGECTQSYAPGVKTAARVLRMSRQFDLIVRYCRRNNVWPEVDDTSPAMLPLHVFDGLGIPSIPTGDALADWLMIPPERLDYLADPQSRHETHGDAAVNHYRYLVRQKRRGGVRLIEAPKRQLKTLQRAILDGIVARVPDHDAAFGFVPGRNCLQGAARHAGEPVVVSFDLKDFFPSISAGRVFGLFRCLGYPNAVARLLTGICTTTTPPWLLERLPYADRMTYAQPHIPQGAPTSPALANKAAHGLDVRLASLAGRLDVNYSRYADDMTFSGDTGVVGTLLRAVPAIVRDEGFAMNPAKTRIMSATSRQVATGVVVNRHLNVNRRSFDRLKAVIHACGRDDDTRLQDPRFRAKLLGQIGWVEQVNPPRGQKLRRLLARSIEQS